MNWRRLIIAPEARTRNGSNLRLRSGGGLRACHITPDSDRESEFPQTVISALPVKADMLSATVDVCYGPKADIGPISDGRSNARKDDPDLGELARLCIDLD